MRFNKTIGKTLIPFIIAITVCFGLLTVPASSQAADPIYVGINQDITGLMAAEGRTNTDAALMAIDEWNAKGGVNGRPIKAIAMNHGSDPVRAAANAKTMIAQGVVAVHGCVTSTVCMAEMKEFARADIPELGGAASVRTWDFKGSNGKPFYFSTIGSDPVLARSYLDIVAVQGYKRIAILYLNVAWPRDITEIMKEWVQKYYGPKYGMSVVGTVEADVNATDLSLQVHKLREMKPDAIITPIYQSTALALVRAFAAANWNPPWATTFSQLNAVYLKSNDKKLFYNLSGVGYWDGNRPDAVKKHNEFVKKYGYTPNAHWAPTYDSMNLILTAIKEVGPDGKKIQEWMATKSYGKPMIAGIKGKTCKFKEVNETWLGKPVTYYSGYDGTDYGRLWINEKGEIDWKKLNK